MFAVGAGLRGNSVIPAKAGIPSDRQRVNSQESLRRSRVKRGMTKEKESDMQLKKFLLFGLLAAVVPAAAEEAADRKTATSLKYVTHELDARQNKFSADTNKAMEYTNAAGTVQKRAVTSDLDNGGTESLPMVGGVNTKLNQKQDDIAAVNDHTAVTYTGQPGGIGQKGIYQATGTYAEQSDNLIDAKTFNAALKKGLDSEFICSESDPNTNLCWVYSIHNPTTDNTLLPADYTPLEYIESTGTQYINTDRKLAGSDTVEFKFSHINPQRTDNMLAGYYGGNTSFALNIMGSGSHYNLYFYYKSPVGTNIMPITDFNAMHTIKVSDGALYVDGRFKYKSNQTNDFTTGENVTVFLAGSHWISARIYYYKVTGADGTLLQYLIPARRNIDDAIGMYDVVANKFKPKSGTNDFTPGPDANNNIYILQNQ